MKVYTIFIEDHTGKGYKFFDRIEEGKIISKSEDELLLKHYQSCMTHAGGMIRIEQMINLINYLENKEWINDWLYPSYLTEKHSLVDFKSPKIL